MEQCTFSVLSSEQRTESVEWSSVRSADIFLFIITLLLNYAGCISIFTLNKDINVCASEEFGLLSRLDILLANYNRRLITNNN